MTHDTPKLQFAFDARIEVGTPQELGQLRAGERRVIPITGGTFEGDGIRGRVIAPGADWQTIRADGIVELDARYTVETDSGKLISVSNQGIRRASPEVAAKIRAGERVDPASYYFRTIPRFETSAPEFQWLSRSIFVCTGERLPNQVFLRFWQFL